MKKQYINPEMDIVKIEVGQQILAGSDITEQLPFNPDGFPDVENGLSRELDLFDLLM